MSNNQSKRIREENMQNEDHEVFASLSQTKLNFSFMESLEKESNKNKIMECSLFPK
jgi:hypothetical protein